MFGLTSVILFYGYYFLCFLASFYVSSLDIWTIFCLLLSFGEIQKRELLFHILPIISLSLSYTYLNQYFSNYDTEEQNNAVGPVSTHHVFAFPTFLCHLLVYDISSLFCFQWNFLMGSWKRVYQRLLACHQSFYFSWASSHFVTTEEFKRDNGSKLCLFKLGANWWNLSPNSSYVVLASVPRHTNTFSTIVSLTMSPSAPLSHPEVSFPQKPFFELTIVFLKTPSISFLAFYFHS